MSLPVLSRQAPAGGWNPIRELDELVERLAALGRSGSGGPLDDWSPLADLEETDDAYLVELELPGVAQDDVDVQLDERVLTVSGEIRQRRRTGILHRRARKVGRFRYTVVLPGEIDEEHVDASLDGGVLTVRVPKSGRARRRRIAISR